MSEMNQYGTLFIWGNIYSVFGFYLIHMNRKSLLGVTLGITCKFNTVEYESGSPKNITCR